MSTWWLKISLVVTAAFLFTISCLLVAKSVPAPLFGLPSVCIFLTYPGFILTELCFGLDLAQNSPLAFHCSYIAFNTLFYSVLFGPFVLFLAKREPPSTPLDLAGSEVPVAPARPHRRTRRRVAMLLGAIPLIALIYFYLRLSVTFIPPVLVRVVDAISGEPIAGIAVTQRLETENQEVSQPRPVLTGSSGYVLFSPYLHWDGLLRFSSVYGYSISVNQDSTAARPWRRETNPKPSQNNKYFGMILHTRCPNCVLLWQAPYPASEDLGSFPWLVTVSLIPALDSPLQCSSIANATIGKQCKDLNAYRSAFLHFDSVNDLENNKAICERLERESARSCLAELGGYVTSNTIPNDSSPFKTRPMPTLPTHPLEEMLPFDKIAGLAISNRRTYSNNAFLGSVSYSAEYGWGDHRINVRIDDFTTEEAAQRSFSQISSQRWDDDPGSTLTGEIRSGNRVFVYRSPHVKTASSERGNEWAYWRSKNKVLLIYMFLPRPIYEEAVTKYLTLYPSSLTTFDIAKRVETRGVTTP